MKTAQECFEESKIASKIYFDKEYDRTISKIDRCIDDCIGIGYTAYSHYKGEYLDWDNFWNRVITHFTERGFLVKNQESYLIISWDGKEWEENNEQETNSTSWFARLWKNLFVK